MVKPTFWKNSALKDFRITIVSLPDREHLVSEIFYKNEQWVEISQETSELLIQFYSPISESHWEFSFSDALQALNEAKNKLLNSN